MDPRRRSVLAGILGAGIGALGGRAVGTQEDGDTSAPPTRPVPEYVDVRQYGAVGDGAADDTGAIRRAIEAALGPSSSLRGGKVVFPKGIYRITGTITVEEASLALEGVGWSSSGAINPETRGSVLAWDGPAGEPMLRLDYCRGTTVSGLRLVGRSTARPSAAISIRNVRGKPIGSNFNRLSSLWIGSLSGYDTDATEKQFETGILLEGDNVEGDSNRFETIVIYGCQTGVAIAEQRFVRNHFSTMRIGSCGTAFSSNAAISTSGDNWVVSQSEADIRLGPGARLRVDGFSSEYSQRLAVTESASLTIRDGYWQMGPFMAEDGLLIDGRRGTARSFLRLEDLDFTQEAPRGAGRIAWDPPSQMLLSNVVLP